MKGGRVSKVSGTWVIEDTGPTNAKVTQYRELEVEVLNALALDSSSSNSNDALLETVIEHNYDSLCQRCKEDPGLYEQVKQLKEKIASIIQLRNEESLDKMKDNETPEEEAIRKNHEDRINRWRNKYILIKSLFQDVRRTLHEPIERETFFLSEKTTFYKKKEYLRGKLKEVGINLKEMDVVFSEIIQKATQFYKDLQRTSFVFETLPDVFHSTSNFAQSLQQFIEQKQSERLTSMEPLITRHSKLKEMLQSIETVEAKLRKDEEENNQIEQKDIQQKELLDQERLEKERIERERLEKERLEKESKERQEQKSKKEKKKGPEAKKKDDEDIRQIEEAIKQNAEERQRQRQQADEAELIQQADEASRQVLLTREADKKKVEDFQILKSELDEKEALLKPLSFRYTKISESVSVTMIDKIYRVYYELYLEPENPETLKKTEELDVEVTAFRKTLTPEQNADLDELYELMPILFKLMDEYSELEKKVNAGMPEIQTILKRVAEAKRLKALVAALKGGTRRKRKVGKRTRTFK